MAFGRSNSLSLNTGATNSLFAQQQQQQQSQPQATGGLFGTANTSQPTQTSSIFGGGNTTSQPAQTSSIFGGGNNNTSQPAQTSNMFGGGNTTSQPAQTSSIFGSANNTQQPANSSNLFGNTSNTQQTQSANTSSLFGNTNSNQGTSGGGGLFGSMSNTQQNQNQQAPSTGLFGASNTQNNTTSGGLFGGNQGASTAPNATNSLFGSTTNSNLPAPSLLGATQHNQMSQSNTFGRLSMGQGTASQAGQAASQVTIDNLRGTTRFEDCSESVRRELEAIDRMIQEQEEHCKRIEALLPKHEEDIASLIPDVAFVKDKAEDVDQALTSDAYGVEAQRKNTEKDKKDLDRLQRVVTNLTLPQSYHNPNVGMSGFGGMYSTLQRPQQPQSAPEGQDANNYDTDLVGNYFGPMAVELQQIMGSYASNLGEIESHLRVIEASTITQAQQLAQRRDGLGGGQSNGDDTVRDLADTLRGFEASILGVAGVVGECREGVNELVLGRLGNNLGGSRYY